MLLTLKVFSQVKKRDKVIIELRKWQSDVIFQSNLLDG